MQGWQITCYLSSLIRSKNIKRNEMSNNMTFIGEEIQTHTHRRLMTRQWCNCDANAILATGGLATSLIIPFASLFLFTAVPLALWSPAISVFVAAQANRESLLNQKLGGLIRCRPLPSSSKTLASGSRAEFFMRTKLESIAAETAELNRRKDNEGRGDKNSAVVHR